MMFTEQECKLSAPYNIIFGMWLTLTLLSAAGDEVFKEAQDHAVYIEDGQI